ncbi:MAG: PEP-utilizing enzyme [Candidatus Micrarchaeota archaeon]
MSKEKTFPALFRQIYFQAIFAQLNHEEIEYFCKLFQTWAHERLELKNCWAGAEWRFLLMFKEIAKRLQIALNDLVYGYSLEDIKSALLNGKLLDKELVRERKELYAVRWVKGKRIEYRKADIPALRQELGISEIPKVSEIKGTVANPGIARGRAYVVKTFGIDRLLEDERNFKEGDIMIINMTQPTHIALVKKSAAIVADEGGVSSHASVISREFGKPCIVGAKIATKVLKTGDFIEVDAIKGIVRKIDKFTIC